MHHRYMCLYIPHILFRNACRHMLFCNASSWFPPSSIITPHQSAKADRLEHYPTSFVSRWYCLCAMHSPQGEALSHQAREQREEILQYPRDHRSLFPFLVCHFMTTVKYIDEIILNDLIKLLVPHKCAALIVDK